MIQPNIVSVCFFCGFVDDWARPGVADTCHWSISCVTPLPLNGSNNLSSGQLLLTACSVRRSGDQGTQKMPVCKYNARRGR